MMVWPWLGWIALICVTAIYWGQFYLSQQSQLQQATEQARRGAAQTAHALSLQANVMIRKIDYIALHLGEHWRSGDKNAFLHAVKIAQDTLPPGAVSQVAVADATGKVIFSSLRSEPSGAPTRGPAVSIADREHFRVHFQNRTPQLFISPPVLGRVSKQWTVQFSRPLLDKQRIVGVIVLSVSAQHLSQALHEIFPDSADVATWLRNDGIYLARSQRLDQVLGKSVPASRDFLLKPTLTAGEYEQSAPVDGVARFYAWHRASDYPVLVSVGLGKANALAPVQGALRESALRSAVGTVLLLLASVFITRLWILRSKQADSLAKTSERLEMALRGGDLGTWDWNCATGAIRLNDRLFAILGERRHEFRPSPQAWQERVHPEDQPRVHEAHRAHRCGLAEQYEAEYRIKSSCGNWVWVLDRGRIVERSVDGTVLRMVGTVLDISARKRAEAAEQALRERLGKLVTQIPGTVYQYLLRADGSSCFPYASPGIQDVYEITPEEAAISAEKVFTRLHPSDLARVSATITESARQLTTWRCEYRVRHTDGSVRWVLGQANPERTAGGDTLWHGYIHDITAEHDAAEVLKLSEEHLRLTLQAVRDGLWSLDVSGALTIDARICELLGHAATSETLGSADWIKLLHPSDRAHVVRGWQSQALRHPDAVISAEHRVRTADGKWLWVESRGRVIEWGEDGTPARMIGTCSDISARVAEVQLRRALLDQSSAAIAMIDKDRRMIHANVRAQEIFARPGVDVGTLDMRSLHLSDERFEAMERHYQCLRSNGKIRFEFPLCDVQGHTRWFDMQAVLRDPENPDSDIVWTLIDITEKHESETALATERLRLTTLLECFPGGVLMENASEVVVLVNQTFCDLLELADSAAALQRLPHALLQERLGETRASWLSVPSGTDSGEKRRSVEVNTSRGRALEINWVPIISNGEGLGHVWLIHDISERKQREATLAALAVTDALTGLPNRRSFLASLDAAIAALHSHPEQSAALLMIDVDHFKHVNDTYGHPVGDTVLQHVAQTVSHSLRQTDVAGRLGGEEFAILLRGIQPHDAAIMANRIREALAGTPASTSAGKVLVTISIGLTMLDGGDATQHLSQADEMLYAAKNSGRNRVCVWPEKDVEAWTAPPAQLSPVTET